ncbi:MAG: hypothetical protein WCH43_15480 [Verrucomicrobiota bacterium]
MRIVARRLEPLNVPFAFLGGAVVCLLVDHPELTEIRPTKDVDVIVEVVTLSKFNALEERLREIGFKHDMSEGAPICRWIVDNCLVDVMSINSNTHGMNAKWFPEAMELSQPVDLGQGCSAKIITAPLFLATKLEAFKDRGKNDFYASHDMEDIITLIDGCAAIIEEITPALNKIHMAVGDKFFQAVTVGFGCGKCSLPEAVKLDIAVQLFGVLPKIEPCEFGVDRRNS